jgi:putative transposase
MARAYFDPEVSSYTTGRKSTSAKHRLDYHIVLSTKYRRGVLADQVADTLVEVTRAACVRKRYLVLSMVVRPEHVHLLLGLPPDVSVSEAVRTIKGTTVAQARKIHGIQELWADGYYAETVGWKNPAQIKTYLERQDEHHASRPRHVGRRKSKRMIGSEEPPA